MLVEGVELDVDGAGRLVDGRGLPVDPSVRVEGRLRHQGHLVVTVRAAQIKLVTNRGGSSEREGRGGES